MSKYQAYPEYKDSGVEWLENIPSHWEIKPLKHLCSFNDDVLAENTKKDYELCYVDIGSVSATDGISRVETMTYGSAPSRARRLVRDGDVIVSTVRTYLEAIAPINNPPSNMVVSTGFAVIRPNKKLHKGYAAYCLRANGFIKEVVARSVGVSYPAINASELVGISVPSLPVVEQTQIANFLDHETAKIDTLIEKQQQLIKLLKEKRQAVISHAVTKGLNPQAPMKDSGVEWLGEVPEHWDALPAKRFFRLVAEPAPQNNDYELLSVYTDIGVRPRKELEQKGNKASTTDGYWMVKEGDIIVNKLLAWMGAVGYSAYSGVTSPAYDILRATKDLNPKFYHYLFRTKLANMEFKRWSRGIMEMRLRLYFDELGRITMPFPPKHEQDLIVMEIEKMESLYDQLISKSEMQISLMQERRTALISAAVTGKIDVRNWQASISQDQALEQTA
ncbi:restriction endonuclease subunit S [Salinivibrio proteolyticus]|uniref:Restriction endonuclease subunit S n=1 Tax=Salinivibrio proteolyticus TaxID=334715 RepID=A0ABY7LAQ2_9GAMM|nr:restriction endonuclease subunit S [Salinivibrio proteolyticus]WBA14315.1 restriction endonuclease subunit S [Salinivibrio proteolyticus]